MEVEVDGDGGGWGGVLEGVDLGVEEGLVIGEVGSGLQNE